jgi:hypothetical protein
MRVIEKCRSRQLLPAAHVMRSYCISYFLCVIFAETIAMVCTMNDEHTNDGVVAVITWVHEIGICVPAVLFTIAVYLPVPVRSATLHVQRTQTHNEYQLIGIHDHQVDVSVWHPIIVMLWRVIVRYRQRKATVKLLRVAGLLLTKYTR